LTGETGFQLRRCQSYRLMYTTTRPPDAEMARYYSTDYYASLSTPARSRATSRPQSPVLTSVFGYPPPATGQPAWLRMGAPIAAWATRRDASHLPYVEGGRLLDVGSCQGAVVAYS